jgi:hypothetical protein
MVHKIVSRMKFKEISMSHNYFESSGKNFVRFEVFLAVTMKNAIFWDVTPCGSYKSRIFRNISSGWKESASYEC